jgi:hypothetical protein
MHPRIVKPLRILLLFFAVLPVGCTPTVSGVQPRVHQVPFADRAIEAEVTLPDSAVIQYAQTLADADILLTAIWRVPGLPDSALGIITSPATADAYGPQLALFRVTPAGLQVTHSSRHLFDDDFIKPSFFEFPDRTLLLADHGSEDAYGVIAWSFENGAVRDLGEIPVALPEDSDVFTRGAARFATVVFDQGRYTIEIPGPLLLNPRSENQTELARQGETARFCERGGQFVHCP